jgi:hypothetical protein
MEDKSKLGKDYAEFIQKNPEMKFVLYIRSHPQDMNEKLFIKKLEGLYGKYKELPDERLVIFIVFGNKVGEFIETLNDLNTSMYLSFIQSEDELLQS